MNRQTAVIFGKTSAMRLGTLLLRDDYITLTQLEQALRVQVLSGGRLGTNLVELGFIDLDTLGLCLAKVHKIPLAGVDDFENADPNLLEAFGAEVADRYTAMPIGVDPESPARVIVAMLDPLDQDAVREMERHLKAPVVPYIAGELRILFYLETYFSIRRRTRFTRSPRNSSGPPKSKRERRATQPFRGMGTPAVVSVAPTQAQPSEMSDEPRAPLRVTLEYAIATIEEASHRNEIADAILEYCAGRFECAALFMVRAKFAIGWRTRLKGLGVDALERVNVSLDGISVFQEAHDSKTPYRGKVLTVGHSQESEVWKLLELEHVPVDIHVVPIVLAKRVVNLIYAHSGALDSANDIDSAGLITLARYAEKSYLRMIAATSAQD